MPKRKRDASAPPAPPTRSEPITRPRAAIPQLPPPPVSSADLHARFPAPRPVAATRASPPLPPSTTSPHYTRSAPHRPRGISAAAAAAPAGGGGGGGGGGAAAASAAAQGAASLGLRVKCGGAAGEATFIKVANKLSTWAFVGAAEPLGIFGECTPHTYLAYARAWREHGLGATASSSHFFHMGSGLGVAVFAARLVGGARSATGVEWNGHAVDLAERVAGEYGLGATTSFLCGSYMDLPAHLMEGRTFCPVPATAHFLYAFDLNYVPRKVGGAFIGDSPSLQAYVSALNAQRTWRCIHTCIPLEVWRAWHLGGELSLLQTLTGKMKGSGSGFTSFIIQRAL